MGTRRAFALDFTPLLFTVQYICSLQKQLILTFLEICYGRALSIAPFIDYRNYLD